MREPVGSVATRSARIDAAGRKHALRSVHRVRLVTIAQNEGWAEWETAAAPASPAAFTWAAWSGTRGEADLSVEGRPVLRFPLGATWSYDVEGGGYRLCHAFEGVRGGKPYGTYVLSGPAPIGRPVVLRARYQTGMAHDSLFFVVDSRRPPGDTSACGASHATSGAARILDATKNNYPEDTGRWIVSGIF